MKDEVNNEDLLFRFTNAAEAEEDKIEDEKEAEEPVVQYLSIWSNGNYLMHFNNRSEVKDQNYVDVDVISKVTTTSQGSTFVRVGGRSLKESGANACFEQSSESSLFTITPAPEVAASDADEIEEDAPKPEAFIDRPVMGILQELINLNPPPSRELEEMFIVSSAFKAGLLVASRDLTELQAIHVRR